VWFKKNLKINYERKAVTDQPKVSISKIKNLRSTIINLLDIFANNHLLCMEIGSQGGLSNTRLENY
jgi:hypothetical protein